MCAHLQEDVVDFFFVVVVEYLGLTRRPVGVNVLIIM